MQSLALLFGGLAAWFNRSGSRCFANKEAEASDACVSWTWANEFKDDNGDTVVQLSPFGKFPNVQGLQVFGPADAKAVAGDFIANARMALGLGLPWYIGHPDHPLHKERYKDTRSYGRIKGLESRNDPECAQCKAFMSNEAVEPCREHGLFAKVRFNEDGKKLISNESFHGHSVNWRLKKVGNEWHPFSLKSVGFTNEPNIPVPAILSANEWVGGEDLVKEHFKKLALMRVVMVSNECSEDEYQTMKNSFGPWDGFNSCVLKMNEKYGEDGAKRVCGRLQTDIGEKANAKPHWKRMANMRRK